MADDGYPTATSKLVVRGDANVVIESKVVTVANVYPGRIVTRDTSDNGVKVADGLAPPVGIAGYEQTNVNYRKDSISTIYAVNDRIGVIRGVGFVAELKMAIGFEAVQGDLMFTYKDGCVAPGCLINGTPHLRVPFTKKTSLFDTKVDVPSGAIIGLPVIQVVTNAGSSWIDVGMGAGSETGHDADGLCDGVSCVNAGFVAHILADTTDGNRTSGDLLEDAKLTDATGGGAIYASVIHNPGLVCDGTLVSLDYTTSNHTVAGFIWLPLSSPGIVPIGRAGKSVSASTTAVQDIPVEVSW